MAETSIDKEQHPEYIEAAPKWQRVRDAIDGTDSIKHAGETYLPRPEAMDRDRYRHYLDRAQWYDVTDRTQQGLTGALFTREPTITVPKRMADQLDDMSVRGATFLGMARRIGAELVGPGRIGALLDRGAAAESVGQLPKMATYAAEAITDWTVEAVGSSIHLTRVVLREPLDGNDRSDKHQYRELRLEDKRYVVRVWKPNDQAGMSAEPDVTPTIAGKAMDFIPFVFFGPVNLDPSVPKPPLLPLADTNIGHYQISADLRGALFLTGQPVPYAIGFREEEAPSVIGAGEIWHASDPSAKVGMLEYTGQGVDAMRQEMQDAETRMVHLGARFFEVPKRGVESSESIRLKHAGDNATLTSIADSVGEGLTKLLRWAAQMAQIKIQDDDIAVQMSKDFMAVPMSPQEIDASLRAWQQGAIAYTDLFALFQRGDVIQEHRTEEQVTADIQTERRNIPPSGETIEDEDLPVAAE